MYSLTHQYHPLEQVHYWHHTCSDTQRVAHLTHHQTKIKHLVLQLLIRWNLVLRYIHSPEIRHKMPRTGTLCELMLLYQCKNGLVHNLVYMGVTTIDFNINIIFWNLEIERSK